METCYKAFKVEVIKKIKIEEDRFGFEPEITAKISKLKVGFVKLGYHIMVEHIKKVKKSLGEMPSQLCIVFLNIIFLSKKII